MMTYCAIEKNLEREFHKRLSESDQERLTRRMQANRPSILTHIVPQKSSVPSRLLEMWYGTFLDKYMRQVIARMIITAG